MSAPLIAVPDAVPIAVDDEIALPRVGALAQEVDAGADSRGALSRERDLLAHDGCQVGGERQDERLELPPLGLSPRALT